MFKSITASLVLACTLAACVPLHMQAVNPKNEDATKFSDSAQRSRAAIHAQLGSTYFKHGQMAIAKDEFERSASIDPNYDAAYSGLGLVYSALGINDKAELNMKKALQLDPENSENHNNYGAFLCSNGKFKESVVEFKKALANPLYQTPDLALMNAGDCSFKAGDRAGAESFLGQAIDRDPMNWTAHVRLGEIKLKKGELNQARNIAKMIMKNMDPPSPEALAFAIKTAKASGNEDDAASYEMFLSNHYPESREAKALITDAKVR